MIGCHTGQSRRRQRQGCDSNQIHPLQNLAAQETLTCSLILQPYSSSVCSSVEVVTMLLPRHVHHAEGLPKQGCRRKAAETPALCRAGLRGGVLTGAAVCAACRFRVLLFRHSGVC